MLASALVSVAGLAAACSSTHKTSNSTTSRTSSGPTSSRTSGIDSSYDQSYSQQNRYTQNSGSGRSANRTYAMESAGQMSTTSLAFPTGDRSTSALLVEKSLPREVKVGQDFDYQIRVTNITDHPLTDVVVREYTHAPAMNMGSRPQVRSEPWTDRTYATNTTAPVRDKTVTTTTTTNPERSGDLGWAGGWNSRTPTTDPTEQNHVASTPPSGRLYGTDQTTTTVTPSNRPGDLGRNGGATDREPRAGDPTERFSTPSGPSTSTRGVAEPVTNPPSRAGDAGWSGGARDNEHVVGDPTERFPTQTGAATTTETTRTHPIQTRHDLDSTTQTQPIDRNLGTADMSGMASMGPYQDYEIGVLAPGESRTITAHSRADQGGALALCTTLLYAPVLCSTTTAIVTPRLEIEKTGPATTYTGLPAEYRITVRNVGESPAENVTVEDPLPSGAQFISASDNAANAQSRTTWNLGTLAAGASRTITVRMQGATAGSFQNCATATARNLEQPARSCATTQLTAVTGLLMIIADDRDPIQVGDNDIYTVSVTNQGSSEATNIAVEIQADPATQFVSATAPAVTRADAPATQEQQASAGRSGTAAAGAPLANPAPGQPMADNAAGGNNRLQPVAKLDPGQKAVWRVTIRAGHAADSRFSARLTSDQLEKPVTKDESTRIIDVNGTPPVNPSAPADQNPASTEPR
jgi:uncharacterized repeat protein (TIGR01451 family)